MIIQTEIIPPFGLCDWACIKVSENERTKTMHIFIPLAEKTHPNLTYEQAVERVAIERFKQSEPE